MNMRTNELVIVVGVAILSTLGRFDIVLGVGAVCLIGQIVLWGIGRHYEAQARRIANDGQFWQNVAASQPIPFSRKSRWLLGATIVALLILAVALGASVHP